jgi:DNA mismatch repair protein MutL
LLAAPNQPVSIRPAARTRGTTVQVRDLFAAQPVRRKIVTESVGQSKGLSALVRRYALAWPSVRFSLKIEGKLAFQSSGLGISSALAAVYGVRQDRLKAVAPREVATATIAAYVADPGFTRGDQSGLLFVVNGRPVAPTRWLGALEVAYRSVLPARRHPIGVFTLQIDPARIDANIHPAKLEIRIQEEEQVLVAISAMLREVLSHVPADAHTLLDSVRSRRQATLPRPRRTLRETPPAYGGAVDLHSVRVVGQLLHTAIVAEAPDGLVLIDQHRAEERALFESLAQKANFQATQDLLIPVQVEVHADREPAVRAMLDELADRGFRLEWFGPRRLLVRSLPPGLPAHAVEGLTEALQAGDLAQGQVIETLLTSVACRAAVRRGVPLTMTEMEQLVARLAACEVQSMCPHGSPIMASIGSGELAHHFGWP